MAARKNGRPEQIPEEFASLESAGEFWDEHDLADYWDQTRPAPDMGFRIQGRQFLLAVEPTLARKLGKAARQRSLTSEALANLWISERLKKKASRSSK